VHLGRFRKADGLADQTCNARPQGQMLAPDFLGVAFAWAVLVGVEVTHVCPPIIGVVTSGFSLLQTTQKYRTIQTTNAHFWVAYLKPADKYCVPLLSRLRRVNQPVISP
jgi:hypothetical protein